MCVLMFLKMDQQTVVSGLLVEVALVVLLVGRESVVHDTHVEVAVSLETLKEGLKTVGSLEEERHAWPGHAEVVLLKSAEYLSTTCDRWWWVEDRLLHWSAVLVVWLEHSFLLPSLLGASLAGL